MKIRTLRSIASQFLWLAVLLLAFGHTNARADQILTGEENLAQIHLVDFRRGLVHFRDAQLQERAIWIDQIERLILDDGPSRTDLNEAERYIAEGQPDKAVLRYERALRVSSGMWEELAAARLVIACGRAGKWDKAAMNFVRLARYERNGPPAAARIIPSTLPTKRTPDVSRAIAHLDNAITNAANEERATVFRFFRYALIEGVSDKRAEAERIRVANHVLSKNLSCPRTLSIQYGALTKLLQDNPAAIDLSALNESLSTCSKKDMPGYLLVKGRAQLAIAKDRESVMRATWPLLRVAVHFPHDELTADALYYAAKGLHAVGMDAEANTLLRECLTTPQISTELKNEVKKLIDEIDKV